MILNATNAYNGSLEAFVSVYLEYHAYTATERSQVGHNDCLDLDPLVYFRQEDLNQHYVTAENLWLKIVGKLYPNRVLNARDLVA